MEVKAKYYSPRLEIIELKEDVILTSGNDQETDSDGGELWGA